MLSYSGLGFGGSGCKIYLDNPAYDGKAGKQLVSVLNGSKCVFDVATGKGFRIHFVAHESAGDPRVGMIGGSYGGQIQYAVAKQDPRVDALIPIITWNDLSYSLAPNNTTTCAGCHRRRRRRAQEGVDQRSSSPSGSQTAISGAAVDPAATSGVRTSTTGPARRRSNWMSWASRTPSTRIRSRRASVSSYVKDIRVPTLLVQGQNDTLFDLQEAVATYRALRRQGTPTRMIWQSWGHSDGGTPAPGELRPRCASIRDSLLGRRFLHWMDHYVRGRARAPRSDRASATSATGSATTVPRARRYRGRQGLRCTKRYIGDRLNESLYLSGSARLVRRNGGITDGGASYANAPGAATSYSETSALEGMAVNNPPSDGTGTFAAWTTPPLATHHPHRRHARR